MDITKNPPPGDQGLAFQTHALQMILFGPFYVRTQHCYDLLQIVSLQYMYYVTLNFSTYEYDSDYLLAFDYTSNHK